MAPITRATIIALLRGANPQAREDELQLYAVAYVEYQEAQAKIVDLGVVLSHPRTGIPMDNPYLKIRKAATEQMLRLVNGSRHLRDVNMLWENNDGEKE